jgi:hypothetical protein
MKRILPITIYFRATLDKGPRSKVQWNQAFLLVKSFELILRHIDEGPGPRQIKLWFSLYDISLEGWIQIFKKSLKEISWFGEPKCKLGSKVAHFFVFRFFSLFSLTLVAQILWELKWPLLCVCVWICNLWRLGNLWQHSQLTKRGLNQQTLTWHASTGNAKVLHKLSHWDDDLLAAIKHQRRKQISVKQSHIYLVKFTSTLGRVYHRG